MFAMGPGEMARQETVCGEKLIIFKEKSCREAQLDDVVDSSSV